VRPRTADRLLRDIDYRPMLRFRVMKFVANSWMLDGMFKTEEEAVARQNLLTNIGTQAIVQERDDSATTGRKTAMRNESNEGANVNEQPDEDDDWEGLMETPGVGDKLIDGEDVYVVVSKPYQPSGNPFATDIDLQDERTGEVSPFQLGYVRSVMKQAQRNEGAMNKQAKIKPKSGAIQRFDQWPDPAGEVWRLEEGDTLAAFREDDPFGTIASEIEEVGAERQGLEQDLRDLGMNLLDMQEALAKSSGHQEMLDRVRALREQVNEVSADKLSLQEAVHELASEFKEDVMGYLAANVEDEPRWKKQASADADTVNEPDPRECPHCHFQILDPDKQECPKCHKPLDEKPKTSRRLRQVVSVRTPEGEDLGQFPSVAQARLAARQHGQFAPQQTYLIAVFSGPNGDREISRYRFTPETGEWKSATPVAKTSRLSEEVKDQIDQFSIQGRDEDQILDWARDQGLDPDEVVNYYYSSPEDREFYKGMLSRRIPATAKTAGLEDTRITDEQFRASIARLPNRIPLSKMGSIRDGHFEETEPGIFAFRAKQGYGLDGCDGMEFQVVEGPLSFDLVPLDQLTQMVAPVTPQVIQTPDRMDTLKERVMEWRTHRDSLTEEISQLKSEVDQLVEQAESQGLPVQTDDDLRQELGMGLEVGEPVRRGIQPSDENVSKGPSMSQYGF